MHSIDPPPAHSSGRKCSSSQQTLSTSHDLSICYSTLSHSTAAQIQLPSPKSTFIADASQQPLNLGISVRSRNIDKKSVNENQNKNYYAELNSLSPRSQAHIANDKSSEDNVSHMSSNGIDDSAKDTELTLAPVFLSNQPFTKSLRIDSEDEFSSSVNANLSPVASPSSVQITAISVDFKNSSSQGRQI